MAPATLPLFGFLSVWATLAVGVGAVSIPIIIHLLNRRRFRVVVWAAMRFLLAAQKQNTRKMRLEQLVLLAVRTLLLLLVILAMASVTSWAEELWRAAWPEGGGLTRLQRGRTHKILVLDGSLSMAVKTQDGKTCFDGARELALRMVQGAGPGDGFNVVVMKDAPHWLVAETALDAAKVLKELESVQGAHGNADVLGTLNLVAAKLNESGNRFDSREVYFFTDLQRSTWAPTASGDAKKDAKPARHESVLEELQKRARTIFVDVGRDQVQNVAVSDVGLGDSIVTTGTVVPILSSVENFGSQPRDRQRVELLVGRARSAANDPAFALRKVAEEIVTLKSGERVRVPFLHKFNAPGTYAIQVRAPEDELDVDDSRTVIVTVKDTLPALLVDGKSTAVMRFDKAAEYLSVALNPYPRGSEPRWAPIRPEVVSVSDFSDPNHKKSNLAAYDCVFLCDVGQFQASEVRRLETHLRRGGGVVFCLGDRVAEHLESYNRLLYRNGNGILPAQLIGLPEVPKNVYFTFQAAEESFREPPLRAFGDEKDRQTLRTPRFRQYVRAKLAADARLRKILSFTPDQDRQDKKADGPAPPPKTALNLPTDDPAIVEWQPPLPHVEKLKGSNDSTRLTNRAPTRYRGKVILITTSVNLDWNSWAGSPSYGALMQELLRVAVSGKLRERALVVGSLIEEYLDTSSPDLKATLYVPRRDDLPIKSRTQGNDDVVVFRHTDTDQSGIYRLTIGDDVTEYLFAVNVPTATPDQRGSESDLTRLTKDQLKAAFPSWDFQLVTRLGDVRHGATALTEDGEIQRGAIGPGIAHVLLLVVLVLLLLEVVLAWKFGHYSVVAGATQPPRGTGFGPLVVAVVAIACFCLTAGTLVHAAYTGDFLGFLPDGLRGAVEGWLGVAPPAPGENSVWHLEFLPFLRSATEDPWWAAGIGLAALVLVTMIYWRENVAAGGTYRFLLGSLRVFLVFLTLAVLLPQVQLRFERRGWPELVLVLDDSLSMSHKADIYSDEGVIKIVDTFSEKIKARAEEQFAEQLKDLQTRRRQATVAELAALDEQIKTLEAQRANLQSPSWRPTRLQLAQMLVSREDPDWLNILLTRRQMKIHLFHLDAAGRLVKLKDAKGHGIEIVDASAAGQQQRARQALNSLVPRGQDSRLGAAVRQLLDYYRGSSLAAVVLVTDGVTTKDETLGQVADYAGQRAVPLFFVGIGDDHEVRDLKLESVQFENTVYVNDRVVFEARVSGRGRKELSVPVVLKLQEKVGKGPDGKDQFVEKELMREKVQLDPQGKTSKVRLRHQPTEAGKKTYIVELLPESDDPDRSANPADRRQRCNVFVHDTKQIKVLYVEGSPRYEFRYIKYLLEREVLDKKRNRSIELKVLLTDADENFPEQDKTALADFPVTKQELFQYDVIIVGDVDPASAKLGPQRLRDLADFVRERGGGLLFIAGSLYNPHAYKNTALANILPIDLSGQPAPEQERTEGYRPELTPVGRLNPIFRFSPDDADNLAIWQRLTPIYWHAEGYRPKPLAEVLLVHPKQKADGKGGKGEDGRHALAVQQFVGAGRCLFFGFDESWRWRLREDELRFNQFWIQTMRYLARTRLSYTDLRLDRQTDYRVGEPIKVTVRFPDNVPIPGLEPGGKGPRSEVRVMVEHKPPPGAEDGSGTEIQSLQLAKVDGSWATYETHLMRTREGEYRFWLSTPDVSKMQPDGLPPEETAKVRQPPGERELLRMNQEEMKQAAEATQGQFYTLATADKLLDELPAGTRVVVHTPVPPQLLWNQVFCFVLVLLLLSAEWILRKRKHLL
jgi:hypothetical protein